MVRSIMCQVLRDAGYEVIDVSSGEHAMEAASSHDGRIDLLISDVVMPGMNGRALVDLVAPKHPGMRVLFVSGYPADHLDAQGIRRGTVELLAKPFGPSALLERVREVLEQI